MSQKLKITAETRTDLGKGASRRLRRLANKVPSILYGAGQDSVPLTLEYNELVQIMKNETFYSQVLALNAEGKEQDVVVRDLQRHPATNIVTHVDFLRIDATKTIHVSIPLHFLNEEACVGVKTEGGIISHILNEVEISCLPADIPQFIEIDLIELGLGESIQLSELKLPEGVDLVAFLHGDDSHDTAVVSVHAPRAIVEEETIDEAAESEGEAGEAEDSEGESED
ncbi:MAG: 50S ribosomal protein L25/general stress protein Ctc [Pseudomonadales bacterium]|nr:50S ribosomal protein L25/general stress protein Ctc [Pseudomonadales bacterium]